MWVWVPGCRHAATATTKLPPLSSPTPLRHGVGVDVGVGVGAEVGMGVGVGVDVGVGVGVSMSVGVHAQDIPNWNILFGYLTQM